MSYTSADIIAAHQRLLPPHSIATLADALAAVERVGFLWPFTPGERTIPALFPALATESEYQRYEWVWGWKDRLAETRQSYYGKVIGAKPTLVSPMWAAQLYALSGNTGDMGDDIERLSAAGRVPELAQKVLSYLQEFGPTGTRTLQKKLTDGTPAGRKQFNKVLQYLDSAMLIAKCGAEGGNSLANVWDLFTRTWPEVVDAGTAIATRQAAEHVLRHLFTLTPAMPERLVDRLFPWSFDHVKNAVTRLCEAGDLVKCQLDGKAALGRPQETDANG